MKKRLLSVIAALMTIVYSTLALPMVAQAAAIIGPAWATKMLVYNASNTDVVVLVVIQAPATTGNAPAQKGCPNDIRQMRYLDLSSTGAPLPLTYFTNGSTGWFLLKRGRTAQLLSASVDPTTGQPTYCIQGFNVGFQGISASCPNVGMPFPVTKAGPTFNQAQIVTPPNGVNGFEGSINLTGINAMTNAFAQVPESIDVTCLGGANSKMTVQVTPPVGGPYWTYNAGPRAGGTISYRSTTTMQNSWVKIVDNNPTAGCDDNCVDPKTGLARPGVFPYGCSICNAFPDPGPACGVNAKPTPIGTYASQFCAAKNFLPSPNPGQNGCQFNRGPLAGAGQKFGGTLKVIYYGPLAPPANCPKGTTGLAI